jgi:hypothetical protein
MVWEIYTKESRTRTTNPTLTVGQKLGRCTLNRAAAAQFEREGVEYVLLMFDRDALKWGIRPVNKKDPRAFALRYSRSKDKDKTVIGAAFSGVTFLRHIGYDFSTTKAYPITWDADQSIFAVQLPRDRFGVQQQPLMAVEGGRKHHGKAAATAD